MKHISKHAWVLLFLVGTVLSFYAIDNLIIIPGLDPADPERGWAWLTTDEEVIAYIKFWFRIFGIWVLAVAFFVMIISVTGYRHGERWAWFSLAYVPIHIGIHIFIWPWAFPVLIALLVLSLAGLLIPFRRIFFVNDL